MNKLWDGPNKSWEPTNKSWGTLYLKLILEMIPIQQIQLIPYWNCNCNWSRIHNTLTWRNRSELRSHCLLLGLDTLEYLRKEDQVLFIIKLSTGLINAPYLLFSFQFLVPSRVLRIRQISAIGHRSIALYDKKTFNDCFSVVDLSFSLLKCSKVLAWLLVLCASIGEGLGLSIMCRLRKPHTTIEVKQ